MLHICINIGLKFLFLGILVYYNNIRYVPIVYVAKIKLRYSSHERFIFDNSF